MDGDAVEKTLTEIDDILVKALNEHLLPGLAVGIIRNGELICTRSLGFADIPSQKTITPDTVFRIGSISKTFTAVGIMQLYEQGKFKLDDPINPYLKAYHIISPSPDAPPVTFRHLLTHTSGIGEGRSLWDLFKPVVGLGEKPDRHPTPLKEYYAGGLKADIAPEQKWAYANHAYATLGQLIEDISGEPFAAYMRRHVFEPLGMACSDFELTRVLKDGLAQGYEFKKGQFKPIPYQRVIVGPAGSVFSTVNEMTLYAAALMNGGSNLHGTVLKPETLDLMMTPQISGETPSFGMGLAFILPRYGGHRIAWHNGGWPGFTSAMYVAPDDKLGVLVFTNCSNPAPDILAVELMHRLLGVPTPAEAATSRVIMENPHLWGELTGSFGPRPGLLTNARVWMGMGGEVQVLVRGRQLFLRCLAGPLAKGMPMTREDPKDPLAFHIVNGESVTHVQFHRNSSGQIDRLAIGPNVLYKRPPLHSIRYRVMALGGMLLSLGFLGLYRIVRKRKQTTR